MVIHIDSYDWAAANMGAFEWQLLTFYHGALVGWSVPAFVMISGALFLSKDIPLSKIYSKYILRIFTALVFWSFMYAVKDYVKTSDIQKAYETLVLGHFHLWFLFMIIGLYMIVPFVKKIAESESLTKYFLVLSLVYTSLLPHIADIIYFVSEEYGALAIKYIGGWQMHFVLGFTGYFLLGYFLDHSDITPNAERVIYAVGVSAFAFTVFRTVYWQGNHSTPKMDLDTICVCAALFVFFKMHINVRNNFIRKISSCSFGAYLVHPAVIAGVRQFGLFSLQISPVLLLPVIAVIVFMLSFGMSAVLNHIPVLKKYIV